MLASTACLHAAEMKKLGARPGSKLRMEGTSSLHDWTVESKIIGGFLEVGPNFPTEPGQSVQPGKVEARGTASITVRSLQSIKDDGSPYSDKMDGIMWDKLKVTTQPRIEYHLSELVLKEAAKSKDAPYLFDSKGELVVGGVTNTIAMPVKVTPMADKKIKIVGAVPVKMSDYKVEPATIGGGIFKTGDEVKLSFEWVVAPSPSAAPAAAAK